MRELLYVPIIHSESDLGSLGAAIDKRSASLYGEKRWAEHRETIAKFWRRIADYVLSLDITNLAIYQDGLVVGCELGRQIVEEAARRGSINHQIILELLGRGAEIRKTEDPSLLMMELGLAREESAVGHVSNQRGLRLERIRLIEERDRFIAKTIDETLREEEVAILFIGAYHNVLLYLTKDIIVEQVKKREKVMAYFQELALSRGGRRFQQLARHLTLPVAPHRSLHT